MEIVKGFAARDSYNWSHEQTALAKLEKFPICLPNVAGAEVKMSRPREDKNPVVIGRLGRNSNNPTITFYGHYDVQPAMEREWATDPFVVHAQDGYFYGRGTSDNKVIPLQKEYNSSLLGCIPVV